MTLADDLRLDMQAFLSEDIGLGRVVGVQRTIPGAYDPETGIAEKPKIVTYNGTGRIGNYSDLLRTNTLIRDEDRRATFVPDDPNFEPEPNDVLLVSGDAKYSIINSQKREIGGTAFAYTMQVRR